MSVHLDPARKHDFVFLFDVRDGNPNGDPDAGGMPRTDPETGQGLVTDVAIKRKIRNMVALLHEGMPGYDIYVETGTSLNAQHERAYAALNLDPKQRRKSEIEAQQWMCQTFYDVRMFGAVMSTGTKPCGRVQGPMQLTFSRSIDTVLAQEHGITRVTQTRQDHIDKGETTEMGNKHLIPYGLYLGYGHFSAPLARRTGVTSQDLETFWRAMTLMFEHDRASTRGEMALRSLYAFSHDDPFGRTPAHELFDRVQVSPNKAVPRMFTDYTVSVGDDLPEGVTLTRVLG
ncbi:type I-C CRISPR-associated protein Cas7/Csd2 [Microbispora sp. NPDC049125]|uniref:type I-C CRISPR-associated protein Cas7/Csd2 n=1 Tax=Microbispora sp. NPDC049125 TaxID=3154929 RepID=UPI0034664311